MNDAVANELIGAVRYALDRAQTDLDFRWHMLDTETHARLMAAEAAADGLPLEEVRERRRADLVPSHHQRRPREVEQEQEIDELRAELVGRPTRKDCGDPSAGTVPVGEVSVTDMGDASAVLSAISPALLELAKNVHEGRLSEIRAIVADYLASNRMAGMVTR